VAPLGGKILFKDLQYTTQNANLRVIDGQIQISWWLLFKQRWKTST